MSDLTEQQFADYVERSEADLQHLRAENDRLREALTKIANTYDESWKLGSQERSIGDLARAALAKGG
jgi:hypothetical protein